MQRQPAVITGTVGVIVVASWTLLAAGRHCQVSEKRS